MWLLELKAFSDEKMSQRNMNGLRGDGLLSLSSVFRGRHTGHTGHTRFGWNSEGI